MEMGLRSPAILKPKNRTTVLSSRQLIGLTAVRLRLRLLRAVSRHRAEAEAARLFLTPPRHHIPAEEQLALKDAHMFSIPLMSGHMAVWRWGNEHAPQVVLVHGWGGRGTQLHHFVRPLLDRGFAVVTFDAPGHGMSTGKESSMLHFLGALETLLGKIGPVHALIGHSMGGAAIASALGRGIQAQRAVLLAAPASLIDASHRFARILQLPESLRTGVQNRIQKHFGTPWDVFEAEHGATSHPLLVIHDTDDREVPATDAQRYLDAWPQARSLRTTGLGHRRLLRDADVVAKTVAFITESGS